METRILGSTGLKVSLLGVGGIPFQRISQGEVTRILAAAKELGVNFIDSARGYTVSEALIGESLEAIGREHFYLATKSMARDRETMAQDIQISLDNFRTDYIELYQCHNLRTVEQLEMVTKEGGAMEALLEAKAQGRIGHIGMTSHSVDVLKVAVESGLFETIQFPYNPMERQGEEVFQLAKEKNIGVIIMKPVAGGAIKNKDLSLRFIFENENITVAIPGVDTVGQLEQNASLATYRKPLNEEERKTIMDEAEELGDHFCRRCGYCAPCTVGIDIPTNFLMEGYYTRYDLKEWATMRYDEMEKNAGDCIECGVCEKRCPYDLPIIEMLKNVDQIFSNR